MTRTEWARIVRRIAAAWPERLWPDATVELGWDLMSEEPTGDVGVAVESAIRSGRVFPPGPGELYHDIVTVRAIEGIAKREAQRREADRLRLTGGEQ